MMNDGGEESQTLQPMIKTVTKFSTESETDANNKKTEKLVFIVALSFFTHNKQQCHNK